MEDISKRHEKYRKSKKEKRRKQSKRLSSENQEEWVEKESDHKPLKSSPPESEKEKNHHITKKESCNRDEWMSLEVDFSSLSSKKEDKKEKETTKPLPEKIGQSSRELNPYWRNGGDGLPPENKYESYRKDQYRDLQRKSIGRETENRTTKIERDKLDDKFKNVNKSWKRNEEKSISEVRWKNRPSSSSYRYGKDSTSDKFDHYESSRSGSSKSYGQTFRKPEYVSENENFTREKRLANKYENDIKSVINLSSTKKGWKKNQDQPEIEVNEKISACSVENISNDSAESSKFEMNLIEQDSQKILSVDEMNMLCAKMFKAEMKGNQKLAEELRTQVAVARRMRDRVKGNNGDSKDKEIIILTETDSKGFSRPLKSIREERLNSKRKVETHEGNKRMRYFADDDSLTLSEMFEKERFGSSGDQNATFMKLMRRVVTENNEDAFEETASMESTSRQDKKDWDNAVKRYSKREKAMDNCYWCLDSKSTNQDVIVAIRNTVHLCVPSSQSLTEGHCIIVPSDHIPCATLLDEDVWEDVMSLRKNLVKIFEAEGEDTIFFECISNLEKYPHMQLHCVPVPKEMGDVAPIYFKKAIMECEMEWSNNKKVIDLNGKNVRKAVPKGLPYFAVDFGMQPGYAHVIEDRRLFPNNFAQEIIGGMLDIDHSRWRKLHKDSQENIQKKINYLKELIKKNL